MISIAAVGDISFEGATKHAPSSKVFANFQKILHDKDLCIANLECPLTLKTDAVPGKCTLSGAPGWAPVLKRAGFQIVSLANNHMMDFGPRGLQDTLDALNACGLRYVGAGNNIHEACAPVTLDIKGIKLSILARSMVHVSSPSYADDGTPGVAFFDLGETCDMLRVCRDTTDVVLLLLHWGIEEYFYPTPQQRTLARDLAEAGASAIIGHHPHVVQGSEKIKDSLVVYSLGNFFFDDIQWQAQLPSGTVGNYLKYLTADNLIGAYLTAQFNQHGLIDYDIKTLRIFKGVSVRPYHTTAGKMRKYGNAKLSRLFGFLFYRQTWKLYAFLKETQLRILPIFRGKLKISKIRKIRLNHFVTLFRTLVRSRRIVSEKSTNPYE